MSAATRGPWRIRRGNQIESAVALRVVATVDFSPSERGGGTDEERANALLIAAAPELLEAARLALARCKHLAATEKPALWSTVHRLQAAVSAATEEL